MHVAIRNSLRSNNNLLATFSVARVSHDDEAELNRVGRRSVTGGMQGNGDGGASGHRETAVDESRKEMTDRLPAPQTAAVALNEVFLRLGFVGTLSIRSCSYEK